VDTIHQRDGRTDGRTDTGRQQIPRLSIALRGKNDFQYGGRQPSWIFKDVILHPESAFLLYLGANACWLFVKV